MQGAVKNAIKYTEVLQVKISGNGKSFNYQKLNENVHFNASGHGIFNVIERVNFTRDEFLKVIRSVHRGGKYLSGDISNVMVSSYLTVKNPDGLFIKDSKNDYDLTKREKGILILFFEGVLNKEIAEKFDKSIRAI